MSPYKDPAKQREAARDYARRKKAEWLVAQSCACGVRTGLHVFGAPKGAFTASPERREGLLADVVVMCEDCLASAREYKEAVDRQRDRQHPEPVELVPSAAAVAPPPSPPRERIPRPQSQAERQRNGKAPRVTKKTTHTCPDCGYEVDDSALHVICLKRKRVAV